MPLVIIIAIAVLALIICHCIIHRWVIKAVLTHNSLPKAPKWHVWLPKNMRRD